MTSKRSLVPGDYGIFTQKTCWLLLTDCLITSGLDRDFCCRSNRQLHNQSASYELIKRAFQHYKQFQRSYICSYILLSYIRDVEQCSSRMFSKHCS